MPLVKLTDDPDTPAYEQVRSQIAAGAADGRLSAGTRLPTVRGLADDLGLAVNTVAKAYRELEADGVVVTEGRRGTRVASPTTPPAALDAADAFVAASRSRGLTRSEAVRLVEDRWSR